MNNAVMDAAARTATWERVRPPDGAYREDSLIDQLHEINPATVTYCTFYTFTANSSPQNSPEKTQTL